MRSFLSVTALAGLLLLSSMGGPAPPEMAASTVVDDAPAAPGILVTLDGYDLRALERIPTAAELDVLAGVLAHPEEARVAMDQVCGAAPDGPWPSPDLHLAGFHLPPLPDPVPNPERYRGDQAQT